MNWTELQMLLQRHAIEVRVKETVVLTSATAVPAEVLDLLHGHSATLKAHLRPPPRQSSDLTPELRRFLLRVAHQGSGVAGSVRLPSGIVTNFDEFVLANATAHLAQPSGRLLRQLHDAHTAVTPPIS